MAIRKTPRFKFLDLAHRGVVVTCIGLTLYGSALLGHRIYRYFTIIRPNRDADERRILNELTQELNSVDAATLIDLAPKISN